MLQRIDNMPRSVSHTGRLAAIVGSEDLHLEDDGAIAIAPENVEQVSAILRCANENGFSITPYGAGTKQKWGNPVSPALVLHTRRLNTLREHTWQDMTATVEAGCSWSSMQSALAHHGQFVALDPLWGDRATVGGIVATNDSGPLRLKYGSLRDLIIGMTIVLADGTIARTGGKVVKNVAGYDLHKLMTGAFGTLGIITEVTFRLHAVPRHTRNFTVTSSTAGPLGSLLLKLIDSHLGCQSIQLRGSGSRESGLRASGNQPGGRFALDIRLCALPEVLDAQTAPLAALVQSFALTVNDAGAEAWNAWQDQAGDAEALTIKASMLPSEIAHFAEIVVGLGASSVTQATGIMLASFPAAAAPRLPELRREFEAAGGSLTVLGQPTGADLDLWGTPPDTLVLMREIKRRFDPNGILNPGRFLGGV
jgi:glycolate oxidase FAD binding subunit